MNAKKMLALTGALVISANFLCSCNNTSSKKQPASKEAKKAAAVLDDFCAYLKTGKWNKIEKLVDGSCSRLETLAEYDETRLDVIVDEAKKRISYDVEVTSADTKKGEGEATVVITYFDVENMMDELPDSYRITDVTSAIKDEEDIEYEYNVDLTYDDDWLINKKSADLIIKDLFSFLDDLSVEESTTYAPSSQTNIYGYSSGDMSEFYFEWLDENYNKVLGYHESDKQVYGLVTTWDYYDGETVKYEYIDANGNVVYTSDFTINGWTDTIECIWKPTGKIPVGDLTCVVYDPSGNIFSKNTIRIYADDEVIPVEIYCYDWHLADEDGNAVPGFHAGDAYKAIYCMFDQPHQTEISFSLQKDNSTKPAYEGTYQLDMEQECYLEIPEDVELEPGFYTIYIYGPDGSYMFDYYFQIIADDEDFIPSMQRVSIDSSEWVKSEYDWSTITYLTVNSRSASFYVMLTNSYAYIPFDYELIDDSGKVIDSGRRNALDYDYVVIFNFTFDSLKEGELTLKIYNPDSSVLVESSITVKP